MSKFKVTQGNIKFQKYIDRERQFLEKHLSGLENHQYNDIRMKLNSLMREYRLGNKTGLVLSFIEAVKHYQKKNGGIVHRSVDKHKLSDHAFCMMLVRHCDFDISSAKDKVLKMIYAGNIRYAEVNGRIVTVLPD